jgi:hypothetical protein
MTVEHDRARCRSCRSDGFVFLSSKTSEAKRITSNCGAYSTRSRSGAIHFVTECARQRFFCATSRFSEEPIEDDA